MRIALAVSLFAAVLVAQAEFGVTEIADYRLDTPAFAQFNRASHLIAAATRADARFEREPLFTKDILLSDDVLAAAISLETRLRNEPALAGAFVAADITPHDYTKFALALVAARLAYGFVQSGVLRSPAPGVHADNGSFIGANLAEVGAVLKEMGVE